MVRHFLLIWGLSAVCPVKATAGPLPGSSIEELSVAAFSPDGKLLLAGFNPLVGGATKWREAGNILRLWDVTTGNEVWRFSGHRLGTTFLAFMPGAKQAISSGRDGMVRIWDVETGHESRSFHAYNNMTRTAALSADGKRMLAVGYDRVDTLPEWNKLRLFDVSTGKLLATYQQYDNPLQSIKIAPDGKWALMECESYIKQGKVDTTSLRIWDVGKGKPRFSLHWLAPTDSPDATRAWGPPAAISPDGKLVLACTKDPESGRLFFELLDVGTGRALDYLRIRYCDRIFWIGFTPDGTKVLTAERSRRRDADVLKVFDLQARKIVLEKRIVADKDYSVHKIVLSPDGRKALISLGWQREDRDMRLELWDIAKGEKCQTLTPPK